MTVDGEEKEFPIKYGGGEDDENADSGESKADETKAEEAKSEEGEPEGEIDERSEPADEESELRVEEAHDEL